jgi:beta-glucosidase
LAATGKPLVVVNISGSAVTMPWFDVAGAIVQGWYGGSENGHALVDVLTGAVNPSGKLPFTVPYTLDDGPLKTERQYPGIREEGQRYWDEYYDEGVYIGYRWYDTQGIPVQFPFGYGLSYTTFEYSDAKVAKKVVKGAGMTDVSEATGSGKTLQTVTVRVKNTGPAAGAEVVQLYVADDQASVDRPAKELKGFQKVFLQPGETKTVSFDLDRAALSWFDSEKHAWVAEPGTFHILIGSSSADIRATAGFELR